VEVNGARLRASVDSVSGNYYSELGALPLLGRLIAPDDVKASNGATSPVAVLGYEFWQRRFGADPKAVGRTVRTSEGPALIVGVILAIAGGAGRAIGPRRHYY